jgi:hypothetical protein
MQAPLATRSSVRRTPSLRTLLPVAALALLGACADGTAPPTAAPDLVSAARSSADRGGRPATDGACVPDSKLIGRIALTTAYVPGTWWYITRRGMDAAGLTNYEATIERWFGREFADLPAAVEYLVDQTRPADVNGNGYVCAYETRGMRANYREPNVALIIFGVRDDDFAAR